MKVKAPSRLLLPLAALLLLQSVAAAQDARSALASLPDSQAVLYINARRLINEAAPSVVPPEALNKAVNDVKQFVDLRGLDFVIVGARFKADAPTQQLPEVLLIARGNFSADGLLSAARIAGQGMYREETYGTKTVNVFRLKKDAPPNGEQPASKFPIDEVAATALDANTLAVGIPAYLRDALATNGDGPARLKPELIDLALRDSNTIVSLVADVPASSSKYLRMIGVPPNAEGDRLVDALRQVQLSVSMMPETFGVQSIIRMDGNPNANALSGLIKVGANFVEGELQKDVAKTGGRDEKAAGALNVLKTLTNAVNNNEVALGLTFRQAVVADILKKEMMPPKKQEAAIAPAPGAKKATTTRRRTRRGRR
ncbi:MAG TPA: hypothetical protein VJT82_02860 [Pyrinomonadaceae bacterium]|nr:hypothetical protein [Pyrinomonadaceae bacterium]